MSDSPPPPRAAAAKDSAGALSLAALTLVALSLAAAAIAFGLGSCGVLVNRGSPGTGLAQEMDFLLAQMPSVLTTSAGEIAVLGFREGDGEQTPETEALDEYLVSSLVVAGSPVAVGVGATRIDDAASWEKWESSALLPKAWRELEWPRLLSGQVHRDPPWAYLRVVLTDRVRGEVLASASGRVRERMLARAGTALTARREEAGSAIDPGQGGDGAAEEVAVDLHVLVRRDEGGFAELVEVKEKGSFEQGDRLQLRFRVRSDLSVYAFLFRSGGQREDVFATEPVFPGRMYYGPSEEGWIRLTEVNEVYTLYFIAGSRLEEENEELFENLADLIQQGVVNRFSGLDRADAILAEYLSGQLAGDRVVKIVRDPSGIEKGKVEAFAYQDGTRLESAPELLSDNGVLVRAFSFEVQFQ